MSDYASLTGTTWENQSLSCSAFEACQQAVFNPESSTVVSEWGLICNKAWIASTIISVQMAGSTVGSYVTGYLGDKIGRKKTYHLCVLICCASNLGVYFTTTWPVLASLMFMIGAAYPYLTMHPFLLSTEFSTSMWRNIICCLPAYTFGALLFTACAQWTKDWRQLQLFNVGLSVILFLPTIWAPESLRWLTLKGKKKEITAVVKKMARANKKTLHHSRIAEDLCNTYQSKTKMSSRKYSWLNLWKGPALRRTLIFTPIMFTIALIYYTLSFGIKALSGNFYTNLMISHASELPVFFISSYIPNIVGRKMATFLHALVCTICLIIIVGLDRWASGETKDMGTLVLVMCTKLAVSGEWFVISTLMAESYPTVIRSTCLGYGNLMSRIGGIVAPYLIPNDPETFFISFSIMSVLSLFSSLLIMLLPETRGVELMDTWNQPPGMNESQVKDKQHLQYEMCAQNVE